MRIAEQKIEEVRRASDIVDVIAGYVKLKKRGKNFLGRCPFHTEKTPSFNVSPDRQMYHCFGCGVGGNVFTFVMEHDKVSFVEAVRTLAERAGISLPQESSTDREYVTENEALYNVCKVAGRFFYDNMMNTVEGQLAYQYFKHRGFTEETIRMFGLGYSMNAWDALLKHGENEKLDLTLLEKAGLLIKREDAVPVGRQGSGMYDRFRGRAMFPIFSVTGRVIGFGARKLREDDAIPGKYINSPETPIYVKSRSLYGISQAKEAIREKEFAILVEGYADLISVFQAGIKNIVASSGTALTEEQIELISRYAKNITLVYDADSAGSKATLRGVDLIIEQGLDVKVATLPEGDDPDSFVKKNGGAAFEQLLSDAVSFLDFKARMFQLQGALETPEGQAEAVRSVVETLAKMKDELKRSFYVKKLAERYGLYESVLYRELEKLIGKERTRQHFAQQREEQAQAQNPVRMDSFGEPATQQALHQQSAAVPVAERELLKLILDHGNDMVHYVFSQVGLELITHAQMYRALEVILPHAERNDEWDANTLMNEVADADLRRFIADISFTKYELSKGWKEMDALPEEANPGEIAERCMIILKKTEIEKRLAENQQRMKEVSSRGDDLKHFVEQHQLLMKEKKELEVYGLAGAPPVPTDEQAAQGN
jgi:DNA primase